MIPANQRHPSNQRHAWGRLGVGLSWCWPGWTIVSLISRYEASRVPVTGMTQWCAENAGDYVWHPDYYWIGFENPDTAFAFKMRWL